MKRWSIIVMIAVFILLLTGLWIAWVSRPDAHLAYTINSTEVLETLAFNPSGQILATSARHGEIQLRHVVDGSSIRSLSGHTLAAALSFSPDGTQLVSSSGDGTIRLWDVATGKLLHLLWAIPADTRYALTERRANEQIITINEGFTSVAFSPDGTLIVAGSDQGRVLIIRVATQQVEHIWQANVSSHSIPIYQIAMSRDNQLLLSVGLQVEDGGIKLWHLPDQRLVKYLLKGVTTTLPYSPGWGVFSTNDTKILTFDTPKYVFYGAPTSNAITPEYDIWALDGQLLTPASLQPNAKPATVAFDGEAFATSFAVSADTTMFAWGGGVAHNENDPIRFLAFKQDPRIIVWRRDEPQPAFILTGHRDNVTAMAFSPDRTLLASISLDKTLRVWHLAN